MEVHSNMLFAFIFALALSVRDAVAMTPRPQQSGTQTLAREGDQHVSNLVGTIPVPGLQVSERTTHSDVANGEASLTHLADVVHRWIPWPLFATEDPTYALMQKHEKRYPFDPTTNAFHNFTGYQANGQWMRLASRPANHTSDIVLALAGGTGASLGATGRASVDRALLRRMHYQDKAVMILVIAIYFVALSFSINITYRQACNNSPVTYYSDPRYQSLSMRGHDLEVFLDTFNQAPKNISLRVAGFVPVPDELGNVQWRGEAFQTAFTFSLDLSPWMVKEDWTIDCTGSLQHTRTLHDGLLPEDRSKLSWMLGGDTNDLSYVSVVKHVRWSDWEELATNIKHLIRQSGFDGVISVDRPHTDQVEVYKNTPWANFMYARATRVLCALSFLGWLIYAPYMWLRCKPTVVRSYYRVDVGISEYWPLISEQLSAGGFEESRPVPTMNNA